MKRPHLGDAHRAVLSDLIRDRPHLNNPQIAKLFRSRTGEDVSRQTVWTVRRRAYLDRPGNGHLGDADRSLLRVLIGESWGESSCRTIAELFREATGRRISNGTVWKTAVLDLGLARTGPRRSKGCRECTLARRIETASARKLDGSKVDRSPRVGRSGKFLAEGGSP